ncbi:cardiolipin synthase [Bacillus massiliglaciei]|uniref:cardiolipin synthase n=1 Tax=Bacillus massiliglaciei TaxID=1816693 RepID=UPI000A63CA7D|nr:cardiolipin synthase [Bacillus massiliglaciei]
MKKRHLDIFFLFIVLVSVYGVFFTDYSLRTKWFFIGLYSLIMLVTIFSLILENRSSDNTLIWIYVLLFLPVIGYVFYLYSGQLYLKGHLFMSKRKKDRKIWMDLVNEATEPELTCLNDHQKSFAKFADNAALPTISTSTKTKILKNGSETFTDIISHLKQAKKFIHIEFYIFRNDRIGRTIIDILIEKASEGVEVLFIYDAAGSFGFSRSDINRMRKAGVKVHPFSPLKFGFFNQKFNFRNHRKIIIIDGEVGYVGGLNVGDEYLGKNKSIGFWRDTHMRLEGEGVYLLHTVFLLDWEYVSGENMLDHRPRKRKYDNERDGAVQIVASGPDTQQGIMSDFYYELISCASKSIWIATPYFVPNEPIKSALKHAALKGLDVKIMLPEVNDGFFTHYASKSYFTELLRAGVQIYSYKKGFLHQKVIIIDEDTASLGTANMDLRSFHLNFEVNVFMMGCKSISDLVRHYREDMKVSEKVIWESYQKRAFPVRIKESLARLFSGVL